MATNGSIRLVRQQYASDCGIAAIASALDLPYGDVSKVVREKYPTAAKTGMYTSWIQEILEQLGAKTRWRRRWDPEDVDGVLLVGNYPADRVRGKIQRVHHATTLFNGSVWDPNGGRAWRYDDFVKAVKVKPLSLIELL